MDSLTTAYLVCILIGSIGSFSGAFLGNKFAPIESSVDTTIPEVKEPEKVKQPEKPKPTLSEDELVNLKNQISNGFGGADAIAESIVLFLKTPVKNWETISPDFASLTKKFRQTLTHPNLNKCPQNLLKICGLVSQKYSNMKDFIQGNEFTELGDQTFEAYQFLENTEPVPQTALSASV
jgi:hypothetical protein